VQVQPGHGDVRGALKIRAAALPAAMMTTVRTTISL
jgi:hypothetical protein